MNSLYDLWLELQNILWGKRDGQLLPIQTTPIAFSSQTDNILNTVFGKRPIRLYGVKLEGNLRNTDETVITVNKTPKSFFGNFNYRTNLLCDRLVVKPKYGANRFGMVHITYSGKYFDASTVGAVSPLNVISLIEEIAEIANITSVDTIDLISEITKIGSIEEGVFAQSNVGRIVNGGFEFVKLDDNRQALNWAYYDIEKIYAVTTAYNSGVRSLYTPDTREGVFALCDQVLDPPIDTNEIRVLVAHIRCSNTNDGWVIRVSYTDGTFTDTTIKPTAVFGFWSKDISFDADKYLYKIRISAYNSSGSKTEAWIDDFFLVLKQSIKGVDTDTYTRDGNLNPTIEETVLDIAGRDVLINSLEFSTEDKNCWFRVRPYQSDGATLGDTHLVDDVGVNFYYDIRPLYVNDYKSNVYENLVYDAVNDLYKIGLKRNLRFANGVKITVGNYTGAAKDVALVVTSTILG